MALDLREIVKQAKTMKPGKTEVFQTIKPAQAEKRNVEIQLGDGYEVKISGDRELTITKLAKS